MGENGKTSKHALLLCLRASYRHKKKHETGFENIPVCFSMPLDVAVGRLCIFPIFFDNKVDNKPCFEGY